MSVLLVTQSQWYLKYIYACVWFENIAGDIRKFSFHLCSNEEYPLSLSRWISKKIEILEPFLVVKMLTVNEDIYFLHLHYSKELLLIITSHKPSQKLVWVVTKVISVFFWMFIWMFSNLCKSKNNATYVNNNALQSEIAKHLPAPDRLKIYFRYAEIKTLLGGKGGRN